MHSDYTRRSACGNASGEAGGAAASRALESSLLRCIESFRQISIAGGRPGPRAGPATRTLERIGVVCVLRPGANGAKTPAPASGRRVFSTRTSTANAAALSVTLLSPKAEGDQWQECVLRRAGARVGDDALDVPPPTRLSAVGPTADFQHRRVLPNPRARLAPDLPLSADSLRGETPCRAGDVPAHDLASAAILSGRGLNCLPQRCTPNDIKSFMEHRTCRATDQRMT